MSADDKDQEPSIEEILASIRQIISDDDEADDVKAEAPEEEPVAAAPEPAPEPEPLPEPEPEEDILDLTEKVDDADPFENEEVPERFEIDMKELDTGSGDSDILTESAESAAMAGFARLANSLPLDRKGTGSTTLEDIVKELMKPMLREWLDVHLPPLIEKVVQKELQRIAKQVTKDD